MSIAGGYSHLLTASTANGKNAMPRIAAMLDVAQLSDIIGVVSDDTFVRPIYAGNVLATVQSTDRIKAITVRTTGFDAIAATGGTGSIENIAVQADAGLSIFVSEELTKSSRPELAAADIIVSGGRGVGSAENFAIIEKLADLLGDPVCGGRDFRRNPASRGHERQQGHRRDQQGRGSADFPGGGLRAGGRPVQGSPGPV